MALAIALFLGWTVVGVAVIVALLRSKTRPRVLLGAALLWWLGFLGLYALLVDATPSIGAVLPWAAFALPVLISFYRNRAAG